MDSPPNTLWLRCAAFAMHAAAALAVAVVLFQCNTAQYSDTGYHMLPLAWQAPNATGPNSTWVGPTTLAQAVRNGIPWADDEPLAHHRWNPFGLVLIFEFLSSAFALYYLKVPYANYIAMTWLLVGFILYIAWFGARNLDNWCEPVLVAFTLLLAGLGMSLMQYLALPAGPVQRLNMWALARKRALRAPPFYPSPQIPQILLTPLDPARFNALPRYIEYSASAGLLYLAVLSLFVVGPPSWAFVCGYTGILLCNLAGCALHIQHIMGRAADDSPPDQWYRSAAAILGSGTWADPWVARLELLKASWLGLMIGLFIIFYFGAGILTNPNIPSYVLFAVWWIILLYSSFGFAGTFLYTFDQYWPFTESVLDGLSLAAKVPIAIAVCVAFLQEPGGGC